MPITYLSLRHEVDPFYYISYFGFDSQYLLLFMQLLKWKEKCKKARIVAAANDFQVGF